MISQLNVRAEITSQPAITCQWRRSGVFIVNFERISHLALVFLLLTLNMQLWLGWVSVIRIVLQKELFAHISNHMEMVLETQKQRNSFLLPVVEDLKYKNWCTEDIT